MLTMQTEDLYQPADSGCAHYALVARAIRALTEAPQPLALQRLCQRLQVSESHLQRIFSEWAGVSPKRFAQFVSKQRALAALGAGEDVLGASIVAGLSSPGRLHDLTVSCEAVTPGEARARGAGISIAYGFGDTWFGCALVGVTERGIAYLAFVDGDHDDALAQLRARWPDAELRADAGTAREALSRLRSMPTGPVRVWVKGTNFQIKVWEALLRVPAGRLVSYRELARLNGTPQAVRAVASAVAANPIALLIPCHRVIRSSGVLGEYRWGPDRKAAIVGWEAAREARAAAREPYAEPVVG